MPDKRDSEANDSIFARLANAAIAHRAQMVLTPYRVPVILGRVNCIPKFSPELELLARLALMLAEKILTNRKLLEGVVTMATQLERLQADDAALSTATAAVGAAITDETDTLTAAINALKIQLGAGPLGGSTAAVDNILTDMETSIATLSSIAAAASKTAAANKTPPATLTVGNFVVVNPTTITGDLNQAGATPSSGTSGFTANGTAATVAGWTITGTKITLALAGSVQPTDTVSITSSNTGIVSASGQPLVDVTNA